MASVKFFIKSQLSRRPGFWFYQTLGWGLLLLYFYSSYYPFIDLYEHPFGWALSVLIGFLISLLLRMFYRRIYARKTGIITIFIIVSLSSLIGAIVWFFARTLILTPLESSLNPGVMSVVNSSLFDISYKTIFYIVDYTWPLFVWSTLYFGIKFWLDLLDERERSVKSDLMAQQAQLKMLRYQLNPHFLFNSLSSIQALIYDNPKAADKMLTELSEFLRFSLHDKDKLFIPLREEISIIEKYLSMEKTRFPDRLDYTVEVSDMAAGREVVAFILQPFVENAVKYGMKTSPENLRIRIKAYAEADRLYLEVMNTGAWVEENRNEGTGIRNVFERLQNAYSDRFRFFINKEADKVTVTIEIILKQ